MKKLISIFLGLAIIISLGGCEIPNPFAKKMIVQGNRIPEKKEPEVKKIIRRVVDCEGVEEEDGFTMKEKVSINFVDEKATDMVFTFIYDFDVESSDLDTMFESFDFKGEIQKIFEEDYGISSDKYTVEVERLVTDEVQVVLTGNYLDLIEAFAGDEEIDSKYYDLSYDNVYYNIVKKEIEADSLTCTTREV